MCPREIVIYWQSLDIWFSVHDIFVPDLRPAILNSLLPTVVQLRAAKVSTMHHNITQISFARTVLSSSSSTESTLVASYVAAESCHKVEICINGFTLPTIDMILEHFVLACSIFYKWSCIQCSQLNTVYKLFIALSLQLSIMNSITSTTWYAAYDVKWTSSTYLQQANGIKKLAFVVEQHEEGRDACVPVLWAGSW